MPRRTSGSRTQSPHRMSHLETASLWRRPQPLVGPAGASSSSSCRMSTAVTCRPRSWPMTPSPPPPRSRIRSSSPNTSSTRTVCGPMTCSPFANLLTPNTSRQVSAFTAASSSDSGGSWTQATRFNRLYHELLTTDCEARQRFATPPQSRIRRMKV